MGNRVIKFRRAHFNAKGEFIMFTHWGKIDQDMNPTNTIFMAPSSIGSTVKTSDDQFTGMLDVNGTEIYENDIIMNLKGEHFKVTYFDGSFRLMINRLGRVDYDIFNEAYIRNKKVIGNIHEGQPNKNLSD